MEKETQPTKVGQAVKSPELGATEIAIGSLLINPHPDKAQLLEALEKIHAALKPFSEFDRVAYKINATITAINEM